MNINKYIHSPNLTHSVLVGGGTLINSMLGLAFYVLAARVMGPSKFGQFIFIINLAILFSEIGDWGVVSGLIKYSVGGQKLSNYFSSVLLQRIIICSVFLSVGILLGFFFGEQYFMISLAACSLLLISFITYAFLAKKSYSSFIITNLSGNLVRLGVAWILFSQIISDLNLWVKLYAGVNFIFFSIALIFLLKTHKETLIHNKNLISSLKELLGFSRWIGGSFGIASILSKIDVPFVYWLSGSSVAGIYASAQRLVSIVPLVSSSLDNVFAPKFADLKEGFVNFKDYLLICILVSIALVAGMPFYDFVIKLLFGSQYNDSIWVFKYLVIGMIFFILSTPFTAMVVYYFGKPQKQFKLSVIQLILTSSLYYLLLPSLGLLGIAISFVSVQILMFSLYLIFFFQEKSKKYA